MIAAATSSRTDATDEELTLDRIIEWRTKHISDNQFVLLLSFVVGILAAFAAYILHWLISQIQTASRVGILSHQLQLALPRLPGHRHLADNAIYKICS